MSAFTASVEGIGFWAPGLPSWQAALGHAAGNTPEAGHARPVPRLLAPNERRRAPPSVAVALDVALAACEAAGRDPASLSSVFASTHGALAITDYKCEVLATAPGACACAPPWWTARRAPATVRWRGTQPAMRWRRCFRCSTRSPPATTWCSCTPVPAAC